MFNALRWIKQIENTRICHHQKSYTLRLRQREKCPHTTQLLPIPATRPSRIIDTRTTHPSRIIDSRTTHPLRIIDSRTARRQLPGYLSLMWKQSLSSPSRLPSGVSEAETRTGGTAVS